MGDSKPSSCLAVVVQDGRLNVVLADNNWHIMALAV